VLVSPLDNLIAQNRSSRRNINFESLKLTYRKDLADKFADLVLHDPSLTSAMAADIIANKYNIGIVGKRIRDNKNVCVDV
jgi:hypothetical protein